MLKTYSVYLKAGNSFDVIGDSDDEVHGRLIITNHGGFVAWVNLDEMEAMHCAPVIHE